jgi:hypothetical protein
MAAVNRKTAKKLIETIEKQLGRPITFREFSRLIQGDNSVLSKKNREDGVKE